MPPPTGAHTRTAVCLFHVTPGWAQCLVALRRHSLGQFRSIFSKAAVVSRAAAADSYCTAVAVVPLLLLSCCCCCCAVAVCFCTEICASSKGLKRFD